MSYYIDKTLANPSHTAIEGREVHARAARLRRADRYVIPYDVTVQDLVTDAAK